MTRTTAWRSRGFSSTKRDEYYLDEVPELPWEKVGGQEEALSAIKDAIELPLLHPDLFSAFTMPAEGFPALRPAGLRQDADRQGDGLQSDETAARKTGADMRECFMHVKGPEILNMWVGESERIVREIFAIAREKRGKGFMPFLFIDEAESILGTRRAGRVTRTFFQRWCRCSAPRWTASNRSTTS